MGQRCDTHNGHSGSSLFFALNVVIVFICHDEDKVGINIIGKFKDFIFKYILPFSRFDTIDNLIPIEHFLRKVNVVGHILFLTLVGGEGLHQVYVALVILR